MTQIEKDKIIAELQEKLAEAEKIEVDKSKRWKPACKMGYYCIDGYGDLLRDLWYGTEYDKWQYLTGNCFKTKKEAEEYKKQIEYTARYKNYIEEYSEPIDWENDNQEKYYAMFNYGGVVIQLASLYYHRNQGTIYASSEQIIWDAIREIGEDNFKKYVLGVK